MLVLLYRLLFGYVTVRVTAAHPEKLLNLCAAKGIGIWRVSKRGDRIYFKIGITSFRKLRLYKRNIPGRIHITKKSGLPFFLHRNRRRYGMIIGAVAFFVILHLLSGHVWNICVSGNQAVSAERIVAALAEVGIREGTSVSRIDPEEKRNELLLEEPGLSWAAINLEGSKLTVEVVETKSAEQKEQLPSNIKATEAGVIRRLEIISGVSVVQPGDPVEKGQLLVSGVVEYEDQTAALVPSKGRVYAEVEKTLQVVQPLTVTEQLRTGEVKTRHVLAFFGLQLPLYLGRVPSPYESVGTKTAVSKGEPYVPIRLETRRFYATAEATYTMTEAVARERAEQQLEIMLKQEIKDGELLRRTDHCQINGDDLVLTCRFICMKDIGFEEKMQLDTRN